MIVFAFTDHASERRGIAHTKIPEFVGKCDGAAIEAKGAFRSDTAAARRRARSRWRTTCWRACGGASSSSCKSFRGSSPNRLRARAHVEAVLAEEAEFLRSNQNRAVNGRRKSHVERVRRGGCGPGFGLANRTPGNQHRVCPALGCGRLELTLRRTWRSVERNSTIELPSSHGPDWSRGERQPSRHDNQVHHETVQQLRTVTPRPHAQHESRGGGIAHDHVGREPLPEGAGGRPGCRLFDRSSRKFALSKAGREFLPEAEQILEQMKAMRGKIRAWADWRQGAITHRGERHGVSVLLPPTLRSFAVFLLHHQDRAMPVAGHSPCWRTNNSTSPC